jgi:hypothetical protein
MPTKRTRPMMGATTKNTKTSEFKLPRVSEHEEQSNLFLEVRFKFMHREDYIDDLFFSVPNGMWAGGQNKWALINKFKKEGMKTGVADVLYLQPRGDYSCLAIEMKATDQRNNADAVSPEQSRFLASINAAGGWGEVCYGAEEAIRIFETYMSMEAR